jgi:16S rRNA (adenine1518-N6/adenine1519-N6)-dimethyltransferase
MANPSFFASSIRAKKSLGQNFLVDEQALTRISEACEVTGKNIVEVGPGYGALTERLLAKKPKSLTLVELDVDMVQILQNRCANGDLKIPEGTDLQIICGDILAFHPSVEPYRVIANIPYYITSPILERFLYVLPTRPEEMVILMQREVGDRIRAKDGKESGLSLFCKNACEYIEEVTKVGAGCFRPAPKVDSAVLRFIPSQKTKESSMADAQFLRVLRAGFSSPRKKLSSNLQALEGASKERIAEVF